jgi:hypothetical protein
MPDTIKGFCEQVGVVDISEAGKTQHELCPTRAR